MLHRIDDKFHFCRCVANDILPNSRWADHNTALRPNTAPTRTATKKNTPHTPHSRTHTKTTRLSVTSYYAYLFCYYLFPHFYYRLYPLPCLKPLLPSDVYGVVSLSWVFSLRAVDHVKSARRFNLLQTLKRFHTHTHASSCNSPIVVLLHWSSWLLGRFRCRAVPKQILASFSKYRPRMANCRKT